MFNVMKAQTFQLLRSNSTYYVFLFGLFMSGATAAIMIADGVDVEMKGSTWLIIMSGVFEMLLPMIAIVFSVIVCNSDMGDKTINYEILTGKRRSDIFFGRAIVSTAMTVLCCLIAVVVPILCVTAFMGWGHTMTVSDVALRIAAMLFPVIRLAAFFVLLSFLFGNKSAVIATSFVVMLFEMIVISFEEIIPATISMSLFSVDIISRIFTIQNIGFDYIDGKDVQVVKDVLEMSTLRTAAVSGIAGTIVFLLIGYAFFRKRDMN